MKSLIFSSVAALAAFGGIQAPAFALNLISNGGFESPQFATGSINQVSDTIIPDWASSTTSMEIWNGTQDRNGQTFTPYEGTQYAEIQDSALDTSIFQTVLGTSTTAGNLYAIQFAHRGRTSTDRVKLTVKDTVTNNFLLDQNYDTGNTAWQFYNTSQFVATGNNLEVRFTAIAPSPVGGQGNFLDAVSFEEVPSPLPLLGAGTAFAFSRRLRRRIEKFSAKTPSFQ